MFLFSWRARRQFFYFAIFALAILAIISGIVWYFWPVPSCLDAKQNQGEQGIDCGGPCTPCLGEIKDISQKWVRFFKSQEGFYDIAALIENSNLFAGIPSVKYRFKLYDANNVLIAIREASTFINPGENQVIFESNIFTGPRTPHDVYLEFDAGKNWKYLKKEQPFLSVVKKDFVNTPFPRLSVEVRNERFTDVKNVLVSAVLYDVEGNAQGVSVTKIDVIPAESNQTAFLTWPVSFEKEPEAIEVFVATNLTGE
ncbi:MAG: hypothetical protein Q8N42_01785 [bacterium]|nr:hypothetical protein [bacterium]